MTMRFRSSPVVASATSKPRVDRAAGMIYAASAMQTGEASDGRGIAIDGRTLEQLAAMGNAAPSGIKVRFTHPGMCEDGLGHMLGRQKNFRVEGDKVVGDIHFNETSANTPKGNLRDYVLRLAEEDPESFGMSVVVKAKKAWKLSDGAEAITEMRPENAVGTVPFLRVEQFAASDVVDEPAANREGLFSQSTNLDAAEAFDTIDDIRERTGLSVEKSAEFLARYFAARGLPLTVSKTTADTSSANSPKGNAMKPEELKSLKAKHPDHAGLIVDMFADGKAEVEILAAIKDVELSASNERAKALAVELKAKDEAHVAALAAKTEELTKLSAKVAELEKKIGFKANAGEDPGSDSSKQTSDPIATEWAAMNEKAQADYFNNIDAFREAKRLMAADRLAAGKES